MKKLTLNKSGKFDIMPAQFTPTQCTKQGHMDYFYDIKCVIENPQLDESGFLVDHHEIDKAVHDYFSKAMMTSCETSAINCATHVIKTVFVKNLVEFHISIHPNMNNRTTMMLTLDRDEIRSLQLDAAIEGNTISPIGKNVASIGTLVEVADDEMVIKRSYVSHLHQDEDGHFFAYDQLDYGKLEELTKSEDKEVAGYATRAKIRIESRERNRVRSRMAESILDQLEWRYLGNNHVELKNMTSSQLLALAHNLAKEKSLAVKVQGLTVAIWLTAVGYHMDKLND